MKAYNCRKPRESFVEKIEPDVDTTTPHSHVADRPFHPIAGQIQCGLSNFRFRAIRMVSDKRDAFAIELPALEIHSLVGFGRILKQNCIEANERLDDGDPVRTLDCPKAYQASDECGCRI